MAARKKYPPEFLEKHKELLLRSTDITIIMNSLEITRRVAIILIRLCKNHHGIPLVRVYKKKPKLDTDRKKSKTTRDIDKDVNEFFTPQKIKDIIEEYPPRRNHTVIQRTYQKTVISKENKLRGKR